MRLAILTAAAFLLASGSALADGKDKKGFFCSPGYYMNHDGWQAEAASCGLDVNALEAELECDGCTGGRGVLSPGERKNAAAEAINACLAVQPCEDD